MIRWLSGATLRPAVLLIASLALGCAVEEPAPQTETPLVPLPPFATAVETFSAGPRHLERYFKLDGQHSFPDVIAFYENFALLGGWVKIGPEEEHWSSWSWHELRDGQNRVVKQFTAHWASPSRTCSLRLAIRLIPDEARSGAWVIVNDFELLGQPEWLTGREDR